MVPISVPIPKAQNNPHKSISALPKTITDRLLTRYTYSIPNLAHRLGVLSVVPLQTNVGHLPAQDAHKNAQRYASHFGHYLYVGYVVQVDNSSFSLNLHSWCVDKKTGGVIEPTKDIIWTRSTHYIGLEVPEHLYKNLKWLNNFNRADALSKWPISL